MSLRKACHDSCACPPQTEVDPTVESEVRDHWEKVIPEYLRQQLAERNGGMDQAYEAFAAGHRESVERRRRQRTQHFAYHEFDVLTGATTCVHCGWAGETRGIYDVTKDLIVECPGCGDLLVTVELPSAGVPEAECAVKPGG